MGWRPIEFTEEEEKAAAEAAKCEYPKFEAIGDKLMGKFVEYKKKQGTYGEEHQWYFTDKDHKRFCVTANADLHRKLVKAKREGFLKEGTIAAMEYTANKDIGKQYPLKVIKLRVAESPAAAPPPRPAPPPPEDEWS